INYKSWNATQGYQLTASTWKRWKRPCAARVSMARPGPEASRCKCGNLQGLEYGKTTTVLASREQIPCGLNCERTWPDTGRKAANGSIAGGILRSGPSSGIVSDIS